MAFFSSLRTAVYLFLGSRNSHLIWLGALGYFLGHPNLFISFPFFTLLSPACLFLLSKEDTCDLSLFKNAWLMGTIGLFGAVYWIYYPVHDIGMLPMVLTFPCILLLSGFLALYPAAACIGMRQAQLLLSRILPFACFFKNVLEALCAGTIFAGFEVICGFLFTGFPWFNLASAFAFWPHFAQIAAILGSYGVTAFYATCACLVAFGCMRSSKGGVYAGLLGCILIAGSGVYGNIRLSNAQTPVTPPFTVALIQGNMDQNQKWDEAFLQSTVDIYTNLTRDALEKYRTQHPQTPVDLTVWPETAMPFMFSKTPHYAAQVRSMTKQTGSYLAFGTLGYKPSTNKNSMHIYNRLHVLAPDGKDAGSYDKQHLVPFGEYIPFTLPIPFLENILQGVDFSQGTKSDPIELALSQPKAATLQTKNIAIGSLICYEAIFPELAQDRVKKGATVLLTISNDAWFGNSSAPLQHLGLATMRAIEQKRPLLRATNTGITAVADGYGRLTLFGTLFSQGAFITSIQPETTFTFFHCYGNVIQFILSFIAITSLVLYFLRKYTLRKKRYYN